MPMQRALPAWAVLNAAHDTSASGMTDPITGYPYNSGGLNLGDYFDLTNAEAFKNCKPATGVLYAGRYRRIQVDSGATAANVKTGTIGLMPSLAAVVIDVGKEPGNIFTPSMNVVTSFDQAIGNSTIVRPVVFLNSITPGNFGWVQELGVATVLGKAGLTNATPKVGDVIISATSGLADDPTQTTQPTYAQIGQIIGDAIDLPVSNGLFRILLDGVPTVQD